MNEHHQDSIGKWLGIVVFIGGILLLAVVFFLAYQHIGREEALGGIAPGGRPITEVIWFLVIRVLFLFVMGYVASVVAARGIAMYQASRER